MVFVAVAGDVFSPVTFCCSPLFCLSDGTGKRVVLAACVAGFVVAGFVAVRNTVERRGHVSGISFVQQRSGTVAPRPGTGLLYSDFCSGEVRFRRPPPTGSEVATCVHGSRLATKLRKTLKIQESLSGTRRRGASHPVKLVLCYLHVTSGVPQPKIFQSDRKELQGV